MSGVRGPRWPVVVAAIGVLAVVAGVGRLIGVWILQGAAVADPEASVLSGVLGGVGAVAALWGWVVRRHRVAGLPATAEQVDQAAASLAGMVGEQWDIEALARGLGDPEPMPVRWRLTSPALMDHRAVISPAATLGFAESADRIDSLTAAFQALPTRRLVISGVAGSGKTTLAVQLLRELLAQSKPGEPVPVLFSLTSWDPGLQPRVQDWLARQLEETYPALQAISADAAASLAAQNRILPILDGLDEVPPTRRAGIIAALNASLLGGVVMTSRRPEYRTAIHDAGDVLTAAAVIGPLALTATEAAAYLDNCLPPDRPPAWDDVLTALRSGAATSLAAVTATPFGLWLIRTIYLDGPPADRPSPRPLVDSTYPTAQRLTDHLLDHVIPAVIRVRPPLPRRRRDAPDAPLRPVRDHRPEEIRRWLTTLAEELRDTGSRDWRWWEMAHHTFPTYPIRWAILTLIGLVVGLVFWLVFGLMVALVGWISGTVTGLAGVEEAVLLDGLARLRFGLLFGLLFELIFVLVLGMRGGLRGEQPRHADFRWAGRRRQLLRSLMVGLGAALVFALLFGVLFGLVSGSLEALPLHLLFAAAVPVGVAVGLAQFWSSSALGARATSPSISFTGDYHLNVAAALAIGLAGGSAVMMVYGQDSVEGGLVYGLAVAVALGLGRWLAGSWAGFAIATTRQLLRRPAQLPTPWRVMPMLQGCYRLGLLRAVGPIYQFRHAQLQDHLAAPGPGL